MKKNLLRALIIILIILCLIMVFKLSNETAKKSSKISLKIARLFSDDKATIKIIEAYIRKIAHLSEYFVERFSTL